MQQAFHDPDRYMADLRQILAQGKKRIGLLLGAGTPLTVTVDEEGRFRASGRPLIPAVAGLTEAVLGGMSSEERHLIEQVCSELGPNLNVELILSQVRLLSRALGAATLYSFSADGYDRLALKICNLIGTMVNKTLPLEQTPYSEFVAWISGVPREHPIEIFTPNYDLLFEEALERALVPYFDGFSGANAPFFDPSTVARNDLPSRWVRLWKLHGSLGWTLSGDRIVRAGGREATQLIYPDHLKYDQTKKLPYAALFDRLRSFLSAPDTLLITCGFSYTDAHISAVLEESLASNSGGSAFACQYKTLDEESNAVEIALRRPNLSIYARDGAVINCIQGRWEIGALPSEDWRQVRLGYWTGTHKTLAMVLSWVTSRGLHDFWHSRTLLFLLSRRIVRSRRFEFIGADHPWGDCCCKWIGGARLPG